jgi:siroheme synthase-like protein
VVVAPEVCQAIAGAGVRVERREFHPSDLNGAWFVVAAAPPEVNRHVAEEAERRQVFVNAVDDPSNASVYLGGVVRRGGVTLGISTDGAAPALAGLLREALDALLPRDLETWTAHADELRRWWRERAIPMEARRPELLDALNALYESRETLNKQPVARSSGPSDPSPELSAVLSVSKDDERRLVGAGGGPPPLGRDRTPSYGELGRSLGEGQAPAQGKK